MCLDLGLFGARNEMSAHRAAYYERIDAVLAVTTELIASEGVRNVTLAHIAARTGITRQWLHQLFPDLQAIYALIYKKMKLEVLRIDERLPVDRLKRIEHQCAQVPRWLDMPVAYALLGSYILNGSSRNSSQGSELRSELIADMKTGWAAPLTEQGVSEVEISAGIFILLNALFGVVVAIHDGITRSDAAEIRLVTLIRSFGQIPLTIEQR
jgi:AcrR family transcriptional regulator